jgi:hypothetical protein
MSKTTNETEFPAKDLKKLPDNWAESANSMKEDELKKVIVECEGNIYTIDQAKVEDHKLQGAKELSKELAAPYRDASSGQKAKIKYALWLLSGRGVDLDHTDAAD